MQLIKKFPAFYGTRKFNTVLTSARKAAATVCIICHARKIIHVKKCPIKILRIINWNFQTIANFTTYKELELINHRLQRNIMWRNPHMLLRNLHKNGDPDVIYNGGKQTRLPARGQNLRHHPGARHGEYCDTNTRQRRMIAGTHRRARTHDDLAKDTAIPQPLPLQT